MRRDEMKSDGGRRQPWLPTLNLLLIAGVLGNFLWLFSLTMLLPLAVESIQGANPLQAPDSHPLRGFVISTVIGCVVGGGLALLGLKAKGEFFRKEGILCVASIWILTGLVGGLPFYFTGGIIESFWDGTFESVSGLTTTGSSIFGGGGNAKISTLPTSILFWRSWLHWVGGIGIVVMFLIFLPVLGITEKTLFQAEVAGVSKEGLRPRIRSSAAALLRVYLVITVALIGFFWLFGMNVFEAVCHSFATIATGGFSTRDYSVGEFGSFGIELTAILGMLMAATNFGLYHKLLQSLRPRHGPEGPAKTGFWQRIPLHRRHFRIFFHDPEFRFYIVSYAIGALSIAVILFLWGQNIPAQAGEVRAHDYGNAFCALRDAGFQTASLISSTGFANSNLLEWPILAQAILMALMFGGGCGGSTGGGVKSMRMLVIFKLLGRNFRRFLQPRAVEPLRIGGHKVEEEVIDRVLSLFAAWVFILGVGTLLLLLLVDLDALGAASTMLTCLSNMGPAFTNVVSGADGLMMQNPMGVDIGSYGSFGAYPSAAKVLMAFVMILGRLEVFTLLVVFMPRYWRS